MAPRLASRYTPDYSTTVQPPLTHHKVGTEVEFYGSKSPKTEEHVDETPGFKPGRIGVTGECSLAVCLSVVWRTQYLLLEDITYFRLWAVWYE